MEHSASETKVERIFISFAGVGAQLPVVEYADKEWMGKNEKRTSNARMNEWTNECKNSLFSQYNLDGVFNLLEQPIYSKWSRKMYTILWAKSDDDDNDNDGDDDGEWLYLITKVRLSSGK